LDDRILGCHALDFGVDAVAELDHGGDDAPREVGRVGVALRLGEVPFEHRGRGALAEVRLEDRR
jgi:hypothetical protein